jgi:murein L,D-transpeptidase YcbB/YkuD
MRWNALILLALLSSPTFAQVASVEQEIQEITDGLLSGDDLEYLPAEALVEEIIPAFYERRDFQPAWQVRAVAQQVLDLIASSADEGLEPADYHYQELLELKAQWEQQPPHSNRLRAQFDVLLTDGMLIYARHLIEGKVNPGPLEYSWNYSRRQFLPDTVVQNVSLAIDEGRVGEELARLAPDFWFYRQLKEELRFYRNLNQQGPFLPLPADEVLRKGDSHGNVVQLRQRLSELNYFAGEASESPFFDTELLEAVKSFQAMHGLDADGIVGAGTFAALNTSPQQRIDQIRINMDRIRWVQEDVSENFLVVNIAGFELYYIKNETLVWQTEVMTGTVATQTPMFRATIKYLVFNPTWTVPRSIIRRSLYGKFSSDPDYISNHNYKLYNSAGTEVLPAQLDWSGLSRSNFPYRVVQQPGPNNALGRVKFMFPNKHAIYLHDTPNQQLFERSARAFSAGCVRVQQPLQLAELLLADPDLWQHAQIEEVVANKELKTVHLAKPIDVLLMYWTASPTAAGRIKFHPDIYKRDAGVLARLNAPPTRMEL